MGKRVAVTGGAGFIGSELARALVLRGHRVYAADDLSSGLIRRLDDLSRSPLFSFRQLDLRDAKKTRSWMQSVRPHQVFHLAANSDIRIAGKDYAVDLGRTFETTMSLLRTCECAGVAEFLFASSSAVFGEVRKGTCIDEAYGPLAPISFYGAAKAASESFVCAFGHQLEMKTRVLRFPNVVGEEATHGVIYDLVTRLIANPLQLQVLGDGRQEKTYLFIDDLIDAIFLATESIEGDHRAVNIGAEGTTSVRSIAEMIVERFSPGARIVYGTQNRGWKGDVPYYRFSSGSLSSLGWSPRYTSTEAVARVVEGMAARRP